MITTTSHPPAPVWVWAPPMWRVPLKTPHHFLSILPSICGIQTMEWNAAWRMKNKSNRFFAKLPPSENCPLVGWRTIFGHKTKHCKGKVICCSFFVFSSKCSMLSCNKLGKEAKQANRYIARQYQSAVMLTGQLCPHHHSPICFSIAMVELFTLNGSQTSKNNLAECLVHSCLKRAPEEI